MGITTVNTLQYVNNNQANNFISIALDKEIFFPGETVTGEIWILSPTDMYLCNILLRLMVEEKWIFVESSDSTYADCKLISLYDQGLIKENNNQGNQLMLNLKGNTKYQFKFSFGLQKELHPSFEYPFLNRNAYIRYNLSATITGPTKYPTANSAIIIKSRPLVLSEPLNYSSCVNVHTWGVMEHGTTIMSVAFLTNNFRYKDSIPLKVTINNSRSELETKLIKLELSRDLIFFSQSGSQKYTVSNTMKKQEYPFVCQKTSMMTENIAIQLVDENESLIEWNTPYPSLKDKKGMFIGSVKSTMIHCQYHIKITCYFGSMVGYYNRPRIIAPLSITYQLNDEFQLEQKENEDMKNALFESQIEYENIKENQKNLLIEDFNDNDFNLLKKKNKEQEIMKEKPMQMSIINDAYQIKQIINNNYQAINQQPLIQQNNIPKDEKPADFVDINAL